MPKHIAVALLLGFVGFTAQPVLAQAADASKTTEEVYKNIVQLKGTPADQLMPAMQFMAASLGVECTFCHVAGKMEADDKQPKKTAREMIAMTAAINKDSFRGQRQVTCFSCHHGAGHPVNKPPTAPSAAVAVTVDQIIDKYVAALGGADAIRKVTSRVMKGTISVGGSEMPIELFTDRKSTRLNS